MATDQQIIEALQQENQRLRDHLQPFLTGPVVFFKWVACDGWPVEYVSPNIDRFGYTADDFLSGKVPYTAIVHPNDLERVAREVSQYSAEGLLFFEQDYRILTAAGDIRWIYDYTRVLRDNQGVITHYIGYILDITGRKEQEEELSLTRFTIDNTVDQIHWIDMDGRQVYANNAACTSLGYSRAEMLALSIPDINFNFPVGQWPIIRDRVRQSGNLTFETQHRRKDGSVFPVEIVASHLVFNEREYICAFARDIAERKRHEGELHFFKTVVQNSPDGVCLVSPDRIITYGNTAMKAMVGYGDEYEGLDIALMFGGQSDRPQQIMQHVLDHGAWQGQQTYYRKDGSTLQVHLSVFAIRDAAGNVISFPGIVRDLTDVQRAEAERTALQQQVIDAQRESLRELSTPLIPITDAVVIMPLIGTIDRGRMQQVLETLLEGVAQHQAELVIVDITGVSVVDTQVAQGIIQAARAVRLLGAQVMLTGIQSQIAQTLVHLGVDLSGIQTRGTLQDGIAAALIGMGR